MSSSSNKKVVLVSSDKETFEVEESVAMQSQTIKYMIEDNCAENAIPIHNVTGKILAKVIEYCKKRVDDDDGNKEDLKKFDDEFLVVNSSPDTLLEIVLAANYLDIKNLLDMTCQAMANIIKDKSPEDVRRIFGIPNDYTPEEEAEVRRENAWAFED